MANTKYKPEVVFNRTQGLPKVSVYSAKHFGGPKNKYRVMIDHKWYKRAGEKYSFLTLRALHGLMAQYVDEALGVERDDTYAVRPSTPAHTPVIYDPGHEFQCTYDNLGQMSSVLAARTMVAPWKDELGEWVVLINGVREPVFLVDLKLDTRKIQVQKTFNKKRS